jgi:hypothetical protein
MNGKVSRVFVRVEAGEFLARSSCPLGRTGRTVQTFGSAEQFLNVHPEFNHAARRSRLS